MIDHRVENIYWMARYMERALFSLNIGKSYLGYGLEASQEKWNYCWQRIKKGMRIFSTPEPTNSSLPVSLFFLLFDSENPLSAMSSLFSARENSKILRDILPVALWEQLNEAYFLLSSTTVTSSLQPSHYPLITSTIEKMLLFGQLEYYLFEEDELWAWLRAGEYIEKIGNFAALLFAYDPTENKDNPSFEEWEAFLNSLFLLDLFRKKVGLASLSFDKITSFILLANKYPYSILSQLEKLMGCLGIISQEWIVDMAQSTTKELLGKIVDSYRKEVSSENRKKLFLEIQIACNSIHQHLLSAIG
ncbi:hypothetical protein A7K73_09805 [Candidatus Methylacidiphilum fumarolicum]|uniref:DUF403 domain-containing protein n=3 Tax=Candidatus Methylacidiphilum fumarolicum TaxID=591154 RepID=I0JZF8_METFB|nr:alpha-E domain-containing protein [Candidatus Methylacidiphilum fumarolicum]TFE66849.1 hypothetical protein A7K73_09805 [Candidatus Methylacidiphilum fumarolicum]TFE77678.1 hypothetical protein A7D33_03705 [Candidatus Methylacidiphilum fumarolicum]CAI9085151.1 Alpha-E domain-containing protein [Candidatus Methylacidiphilum fumarolicum]CCG92627.1 conserved hypothetical protein [Methylacidiphilum fumariolicum SolV]